jgi:hypothetical protein
VAEETYDHLIRNRAELNRIRAYIADNPKKANLPPHAFTRATADWLDE